MRREIRETGLRKPSHEKRGFLERRDLQLQAFPETLDQQTLPLAGTIIEFPLRKIHPGTTAESVNVRVAPKLSTKEALTWRDTLERVTVAKQAMTEGTIKILPTEKLEDYYDWRIDQILRNLEIKVAGLRAEEERYNNQSEGAKVSLLERHRIESDLNRFREISETLRPELS